MTDAEGRGSDDGADADRRAFVRRAYDGLAPDYREARSDIDEEAALVDALLDRAPSAPRVLDAGCGAGTPVLATLADEVGGASAETTEGGPDAVGVDLSREQLRLANGRVPEVALAQADMTALPFADGRFDAVTAFHSLIHVPVAEHGAVLGEFARVLRPGGLLLFSTGADAWAGSNPDWLDSGVEMRWSFPGLAETRRLLAEAGFAELDAQVVADELADESDDGSVGDAPRDDAAADGTDSTDANDGFTFVLAEKRDPTEGDVDG